mgnify:CR=1 FL=1
MGGEFKESSEELGNVMEEDGSVAADLGTIGIPES